MAKFLVRRFLSLLLTMLIVSIVIFAISELAPGDIVRHMLGQFASPEQEDSLREQLGLTRPAWVRYVSWLVGSDLLWAQPKVGMPLRRTVSTKTGFAEWWAEEPDGTLIRWNLEGEDLVAKRRQPDGTVVESLDNGRWNIDASAEAERLKTVREEVSASTKISNEDQRNILQEIDRMTELLNQTGLTKEELVAGIAGPEQSLAVLEDAETSALRDGLQTAATSMSQNVMVQVLLTAQELSGTMGEPDEEYLRAIPNRLSQVASELAETRPELSEQLRQASRSVLARDLEAAQVVFAELVGPLSALTRPLTELAQALAEDEYAEAASLLEGMFAPAGEVDGAFAALMSDQLKEMTKPVKSAAPELAEQLGLASESLGNGELVAANDALQGVATFLREKESSIAGTELAKKAKPSRYFWGVDNLNHAVKWETGADHTFWQRVAGGGMWAKQAGGASEYIPLQRGLLRGDPGESFRSRQSVSAVLYGRLRNSAILAGLAFTIVMPLALLMGLIAGLNEGKPIDRILSIFGLVTTASPNFATGVFLILIFSVWLDILPGATVFTSSTTIFEEPEMLILPVLTLTLIELGYVLRITRASMVEVMKAGYIRTAHLKGLPRWRVVFRHAVRNAMMAPITVIMLHVNWLVGGIVVVEAIFGFPGLGTYLLASALYKDVFAIQAGAMVMVVIAVGTQLIADIIYTFLNPRIRYA